jgi:hypothetical protein
MTTRRARSPAPPPAVTPEQREQILRRLRDGYDLEAAVVTAGAEVAVVRADGEFMVACGDAYRTGTARLRGKLLEKALAGGDVHVVERAVADRARAQLEFPEAPKANGADDDSFAARLRELDDAELEVLEWLLIGEGQRPERQLSYSEGMFLAGQRQAAERGKRVDQLPVSNPSQPLPRDRSLTRAAPPLDTGSMRNLDPKTAWWLANYGPRA